MQVSHSVGKIYMLILYASSASLTVYYIIAAKLFKSKFKPVNTRIASNRWLKGNFLVVSFFSHFYSIRYKQLFQRSSRNDVIHLLMQTVRWSSFKKF